ncbi:MAG: GAF domain-containing protein, partial [Herpetosiphonaceae bacterium]|nr:GAF domain-containing protein [Herpetosiphonaceae bacterium]
MTRTIQRTPSLKSQIQALEEERQQTQRALDALYRIGLACRGQSDPYQLLSTIYAELRTVWVFDACFIALFDPENSSAYRLAMLVDEGQIEFSEHDPVGHITGYMVEHRTPLLFSDILTERTRIGLPEATRFGTDKPSRGWMGVPLLFGHDALGVISLQSYTVGAFRQPDLELLSRLANSMSVALENATLSHRQAELTRSLAAQVELRNADLFVISDIAAMLTQTQPLPDMFGMALDFILDLMSLDAGAVAALAADEWTTLAQRNLGAGGLPATLSASEPPFAEVMRSNTACIVEQSDSRLPVLPALQPLATLLLIPLRRGNAVTGTLLVGSFVARIFKGAEIELLQVVGNQLALALEHGHILEQQQRQIAELEAMSHISYAASRALDPSTLLRELDTALRSFLPIDVFYMAIYDPDRNVLTDSVAIEAEEAAHYISEDTPPRPGSFTEWVLRHRETLFLVNISQEIHLFPEIVRRTVIGLPVETWMGVPMLDRSERPLGVISIQNYLPNAFTERDCMFLQSVASQVSLHVLNVQLFQQRERQVAELNALQRISELVSSTLDMGLMIESIDEVLTSFLGVDAFFVVLYNHESKTIEGLHVLERGEVQRYDAMIGKPMPSRTPTAWVLTTGQPLRFNDIEIEIAQYPELETIRLTEEGARSWLGVPLISHAGIPLGVLTVQSYQPNHFLPRDELFMLQVGRQLTLATQNARLFAQRERQLAELDALQRITELVSSTLDMQQMLPSIDVVLRDFLQADAFQVVIYDPDRDRVEYAVVLEEGVPVQTHTVDRQLPPGTLVGWTLRHAQPLRIANIYTDWHLYDDVEQPQLPQIRHRKPSWLSVPLLESPTRPLGVLAVRSYAEDAFGTSDERFLLNVGRQLALNVRNARLYAAEQTSHRTAETLREIARVLNTTFNPAEVLMLILHELKKVIHYDSASVMLPSSNVLRIVARQSDHDNDDGRWRDLQFALDGGSGAGRVMLKHTPIIINDTLGEGAWKPSPMANVVRSWIGVPLISKGTVLGVLNINSLLPNRFSQYDAEIALTFANQAATALEHARLYQESVTRFEQELEIAHRIQSNLFPRSLPSIPGISLAAVCLPARETGGDFYDMVELRSGHWALMVGDASGKSIPGAMLMAVARSITRSEARDHEIPEIVMRETNGWVAQDVPPHTFVA